jgi:hypothetical protein
MEPQGSLSCSEEFASGSNLSQLNPVETIKFHNFRTRNNTFLAFFFDFSSGIFSSRFQTTLSYAFLISLHMLHVPPTIYFFVR